MVPVDCLTVAVSVTEAPCATVVAEAAKVVVVETTGAFTWIEIAFEVDELKLVAPEYMAVIVSEPAGRLEVERIAMPPEREAEPIAVDPL